MPATFLFLLAPALLAGAVVGAPGEVNTIHGGAVGIGGADSGTYGSDVVKQRPLSKVMNLLKDMKVQLEAEQKEDEEAYETLECWCKTNSKEKAKAIADAEHWLAHLSATIEGEAAQAATLSSEIETLGKSITKGEQALATASEVRAKELAEFNQRDKDAIVSIRGLHSAVETLASQQSGAALLQIRDVLSRHAGHVKLARLGLRGTTNSPAVPMSFLQQPSGEIFGTLSALKESFETNLQNDREKERQAAEEFQSLKKAKKEELAAANEQKDGKTAQLAKAQENHANAKIDLKDTTQQLKADRVFLVDLKSKCASMEEEWQIRQKTRTDETAAVSKALEILSESESRDLASKTTGFLQQIFLQTTMRSHSRGRAAAARRLQEAARRLGRPKLGLLAVAMKTDVFERMKDHILGLIKKLNKEKQDEVDKKDYCVEALHDNDLATAAKYHEKSNLETTRDDLESQIKQLSDEIDGAKEEIAGMQNEMKKAGEAREKESEDFTMVISDQRAMQAIMKKAVRALRSFYDKEALLQEDDQEDDDAPAGFKPYKKGGGGMVIATLEHIIQDSERVQRLAFSDNSQGQSAYEEFMKELNKSVISLRRQIADKSDQQASAESDLTRVKADLMQSMDDLETQDGIAQEVHKDCDFLVKNFDARQDAVKDEVDALYEAIAMMGGEDEPPAAAAQAAPAAVAEPAQSTVE